MTKIRILKISLTITIITLCLTVFTLIYNNNKTVIKQQEKTYKIKINNNYVYLYENDEIIKQYDIDITVLPGEDIEILLKGINVKSISEADMIAEDYDG